jgi:CubicO group peptidase (beta-lactamase class C family)
MLEHVLSAAWPRGARFFGKDTPPPAIHGVVHPDFYALSGVLQKIVADYGGGAAVCVYHRGEPVVDLWAGTRDNDLRPWRSDTMAPSFSTTKGVAATALHVMVDRGWLDYDDRVCKYWPEFAQNGKEAITVRQVLSHQSGLYHIRQMLDHAEQMLDWGHVIRAIERTSPIHPPGERTGYHGLTFGFLVGELAQRVSGQRFSAIVQDTIAKPLKLDGMYIGTPDHELHRAARLQVPRRSIRSLLHPRLRESVLGASTAALIRVWERMLRMGGLQIDVNSVLDALAPRGIDSFDFSSSAVLRATIPAANGLFTARSLARMYAALAAGGTLDGVRLLSPETLRRATERQERTGRLHVVPFDMAWRLGYHGVLTSRGVPEYGFGHFGIGGSGAWADPEHDLAVALVVNSGIGTPFGDLRIIRVGGAALGCARARRKLPRHG